MDFLVNQGAEDLGEDHQWEDVSCEAGDGESPDAGADPDGSWDDWMVGEDMFADVVSACVRGECDEFETAQGEKE